MKSDEVLFLHIGTHKTGTTSFQYFLDHNHAALLARNIRALADDRLKQSDQVSRFNIASIAHHFLRPELVTEARVSSLVPERNGIERLKFEDALVEQINGSPCAKIIGSAEAFCFLRSEQEFGLVEQFIRRLRRQVRFIVVFRKEEEWRRRWIEQTRRSPQLTSALVGLPDDQRVTADWYFDKDAIRRFWSGLGDLVEIDYELHEDIRVILAHKMDIDTRQLAFGDWQNVSPSD